MKKATLVDPAKKWGGLLYTSPGTTRARLPASTFIRFLSPAGGRCRHRIVPVPILPNLYLFNLFVVVITSCKSHHHLQVSSCEVKEILTAQDRSHDGQGKDIRHKNYSLNSTLLTKRSTA